MSRLNKIHSFNLNRLISILLACMAIYAAVCRAEDAYELDDLNVTGTSLNAATLSNSQSLKIITAEAIRQSTANSLIDVLSAQANIQIQSFFGDDRLASVDVRGMGITAVSNVAIFVDGVRLNSDTLASADLSSIPLNNIDEIKIIRGSGSVQYGNHAVGGVIDITTKQKDNLTPELSLETQYGSYDLLQNTISASIANETLAASAQITTRDTDGFRDNGDLKYNDYSLKLSYTPTKDINFHINTSLHEDEAGGPGPVSLEAFNGNSSSRRSSNTPFDFNETREFRFSLATDIHFDDNSKLDITAAYRNRKTDPNILNFSPLLTLEQQNLLLEGEYLDFNTNYQKPFQLRHFPSVFNTGFSYHHSDYLRAMGEEMRVDNDVQIDAQTFESSAFFTLDTELSNRLSANLGYRHNWFHAKQIRRSFVRFFEFVGFFPVVTGEGYRVDGRQSEDWESKAYEFGLNYQLNKQWYLFTNTSRNFRTPNADELVLAATDLRPQSGNNVEAGIRFHTDLFQFNATVFELKNRNEIFFGFDNASLLNVNFNLPETTKRTGFEIDVALNPSKNLNLNANLGYVRPKLGSSDIPLVPRVTANASLRWAVHPAINLLLNTNYVGQRFDGNDLANTLPKLKAYRVENARIEFTRDNIEVFIGVNNLFNEIYSSIAFSQTFFPQPERNFYSGIRLKF